MGATPPPPGSGWPPPGGSNFPPPQDRPPQDRPPAPGPGQSGGWTPPPPGGPTPGGPTPGGPPPGSGGWPPAGGPSGPWQQPPPGGYGGPYGNPYGGGGGGYAMRKASWGARLAAYVIDLLIVVLLFVPGIIALQAGSTEIVTCSVDSSGDIQFGEPDNAICEQPTGTTWAIAIVLWGAAFVGTLAYFAVLEGKRTQTLGKRALGIRTVDIQTGGPLGAGKGIGRYFARILSGAPCYLGYFWPLWDDQSQSFHDKIVGSVVVKG